MSFCMSQEKVTLCTLLCANVCIIVCLCKRSSVHARSGVPVLEDFVIAFHAGTNAYFHISVCKFPYISFYTSFVATI